MHSKVNVHGTSEVFAATKQRVTQAELDVKKLRYVQKIKCVLDDI